MDETAYKQFIVDQLGSDRVAAQIDTLWTMHDGIQPLHLQYLYVLRQAIVFLLTGSWMKVTFSTSGNLSVSQSDIPKNLALILEQVESDIAQYETSMQAEARGAVGQLTTPAP